MKFEEFSVAIMSAGISEVKYRCLVTYILCGER